MSSQDSRGHNRRWFSSASYKHRGCKRVRRIIICPLPTRLFTMLRVIFVLHIDIKALYRALLLIQLINLLVPWEDIVQFGLHWSYYRNGATLHVKRLIIYPLITVGQALSPFVSANSVFKQSSKSQSDYLIRFLHCFCLNENSISVKKMFVFVNC